MIAAGPGYDWQFAEPHLNLVSSVEYRGYRVRAVRRQLFFRPPAETFHEFLHLVIVLSFGQDWWKEQRSLPQAKKHVVVRWSEAVRAWLAARQTAENRVGDGTWAVPMSGHAQSLFQLGFDLFALQQVDRLPDDLKDRLRDWNEFQGVRYEIGVASIFARAGFAIKFCEPVNGEKICEFIAQHRSGLRVAVEAKSRQRPGVLHRKGEQGDEFRADLKKLYGKARKKKPELPFIIFLDANLPPTPEVPWEKSPWLHDIKRMFESFPVPSRERPDPHNMVVVTSYGHYYCGDGPSKMQPPLYVYSEHPKYPQTHPAAWDELQSAIERYTRIPTDP